jgi:transposase
MSDGLHAGAADARRALINRRRQLDAEVQRLRSHLGGLTYEMAIRDHFRLDVLMRRAAILQERESELAEIESLLHTPGSQLSPPASQNGGHAHRRGERR